MANTFFVNTVDVETIACIQSWTGILSVGPIKGDLIEFDWVDGAEWMGGPDGTYSFEVPLITDGPTLADSLSDYDAILAWRGVPLTLRRVYTYGTTERTEECSAVLVSELSPEVVTGRFIKVTPVFQNLSGVWTLVVPP